MRSKYVLLFALGLTACTCSFAQKKPVYAFHSINSMAVLNGENEVSGALQSVNGLQKGNWFAGVGVGLDYYIHRSVPLFADIRFEYGKNKNKFFVYADGGINLEWAEEFPRQPIFIWENFNNTSEYRNGIYTDAGLGYRVAMKKSGSLVLALGHSHKTLKEIVKYQDWRTQEWLSDIYRYRLNRIALKVGWQF